jgi:hypothetical protein
LTFYYLKSIDSEKISCLDYWSNLSTFFGGIINTMISLFSLIILGIITLVVSSQSSEENKKVTLLVKRIESYDRFVQYLPKLMLNVKEFRIISAQIKHKLEIKNPDIQKEVDDFSEKSKFMSEIFSFIATFGISYGHLYKYNFNSRDYIKLIQLSKQMSEDFSLLREKLLLRQTGFPQIDAANDFVLLFDKILKDIKIELK